MPKSHGIFTVNFTIFFQIQEKLEMYQNLNLANSRRPSFGDDINVTFTLQQPVPWIINNYIQEFHISHKNLTIQVKNSDTLPSLCVIKLFISCRK